MTTTLPTQTSLPAAGRPGTLRRALSLGLWALASVATGCSDEEPHYLPPPPDLAAPPTGATSGLPCEVIKLLTTHCVGCHGQPPYGSPLALVSYADLTAKSARDPAMKVVERALARMQDPNYPMPPGPVVTVSQTELMPMQMWLTAGTPMTTCQTPLLP